MKTRKTKSLPDKPSKLIRVALADLEKCERSRKYQIAMDSWYYHPNGKCTVCFAGAVMAQTLKAQSSEDLWPNDFQQVDARKLRALDWFRTGNTEAGLSDMRILLPRGVEAYQRVEPYQTSRTLFKRDMRELATLLAKHGL